jgi:hypothetical protein
MAIGPVQLIVLGFNHPDFHTATSGTTSNRGQVASSLALAASNSAWLSAPDSCSLAR